MRVRNRNKGIAAVAAGLLVGGLLSAVAVDSAGASGEGRPAAGEARHPDRPTRVVQIVLDQLRPEFIDAFHMKNVKRLMRGGAAYPNAYLGHMASETVVSHNVMTSGMLPKHMGWSDEWYPDEQGPARARRRPLRHRLDEFAQFDTLIKDKGYPKLADYLHAAFPGKVVAAIGEKNYAVHTMGGPGSGHADHVRQPQRGLRRRAEPADDLTWRGPAGDGVPTYISSPVCGRFYVDADQRPRLRHPRDLAGLDVPRGGQPGRAGLRPQHKGGDVWVTDVAFKVMDNEDWSGLLLTYGGIDKAGHMWGGLNDRRPYRGGDKHVHMAELARIADEQVGRVVQRLKHDGLLDETLIVLTTDHAQQTSKHFFGQDGVGRGNLNWYYGEDADETYLTPQPEIARLVDETGNVQMSMQDSAIRTWLVDDSSQAKLDAAGVMSTLGGVRATYVLDGDRYQLVWNAPRSRWTRPSGSGGASTARRSWTRPPPTTART